MKDSKPETVNEMRYLSRIGDTFFFVQNTINVALDQETVVKVVDKMTDGIREIAAEFLVPKERGDTETTLNFIEQELYKTNLAKVSNYKKLVLNHGLILLCSIFDDYLYSLLKAVLYKNPQLCLWASYTDILSDFAHRNIKQKIQIIENKLKISEVNFFDFSFFNKEVQKQFYGWNFEKLKDIYKKRDEAAHTDSSVVKNIAELQEYKELFEKLIWNLMFQIRRKWGIKSGMVELYNKSKE